MTCAWDTLDHNRFSEIKRSNSLKLVHHLWCRSNFAKRALLLDFSHQSSPKETFINKQVKIVTLPCLLWKIFMEYIILCTYTGIAAILFELHAPWQPVMQGYGNRSESDHPYQVQYKLAVESVKVHHSRSLCSLFPTLIRQNIQSHCFNSPVSRRSQNYCFNTPQNKISISLNPDGSFFFVYWFTGNDPANEETPNST